MPVTLTGGATFVGGANIGTPVAPPSYNGDVSVGSSTQLPLRPIASNLNQGIDASPQIVWDPVNSKAVYFYQDHTNTSDSSRSLYAVVASISGTSITYGTPVEVLNGPSDGWPNNKAIAASYDPVAQKILVVVGTNTSNYAYVGTVSGTSISFGSKQNQPLGSTFATYLDLTYDSTAQKHVAVYNRSGNDSAHARVLTISGTSVSAGSEVRITTDNCKYNSIAYDTNAQKHVVTFTNASGDGYAVVGTLSGTSTSWGTPVAWNTGSVSFGVVVYNPGSQNVVITYKTSSPSNSGAAIAGTVSGTSISFGSETVFQNGGFGLSDITRSTVYDATSNKIYVAYLNSGTGKVGTLSESGTSITSVTSTTVSNPGSVRCASIVSAGSLQLVMGFLDATNPQGTLRPYDTFVGTIT
jgi:hypothetical protein